MWKVESLCCLGWRNDNTRRYRLGSFAVCTYWLDGVRACGRVDTGDSRRLNGDHGRNDARA